MTFLGFDGRVFMKQKASIRSLFALTEAIEHTRIKAIEVTKESSEWILQNIK